jgi:hypothetical protein
VHPPISPLQLAHIRAQTSEASRGCEHQNHHTFVCFGCSRVFPVLASARKRLEDQASETDVYLRHVLEYVAESGLWGARDRANAPVHLLPVD